MNDSAMDSASREHPFAQYIRILGKGRNGARSLTQEEAFDAMEMICRYEVEPEQISAFMMLLRVKEETPQELAGFVEAMQASIGKPNPCPKVRVDWSSYAGKRRQLPWYLLAALTLGRCGFPSFMHGFYREDERLYVQDALQALDIEPSRSLAEAVEAINGTGFAYVGLRNISRLADDLFDSRDLLGLRSPIHTVARMFNPFSADLMMQGVFHPNYATVHQQSANLIGQSRALAFKGEGGEAERIPERACTLYGVTEGELWEEEWPALLPPDKYTPETFPDLRHFRRVWDGEAEDLYGEQAVIGTLALALYGLGEASSREDAHEQAVKLWASRHDKDESSDTLECSG
jgi:anthranilate phosphoribosyltransferase